MEFVKYEFKEENYFYNEEKIYNRVLSENTNKETLLEEYDVERKRVMAANVLRKLLNAKIGFEYDLDVYTEIILNLVNSLPFEIYPNIVEWINEEELTDIKVKDISLKEMVEYTDLETCESKKQYHYFFYKLLRIISKYYIGEYSNKDCVLNSALNHTYYE